MKLHLLVQLALVLGTCAQFPVKELRPCFERYPNNRLVNVAPYHSEWRMPTEDHCLLFCAQTSSRCRSVVFDSVQHICHFFLDEGQDVAVPAAKMIYLRVASRECLESGGQLTPSLAAPEPMAQEPMPQPVVQQPPVRMTPPPPPPQPAPIVEPLTLPPPPPPSSVPSAPEEQNDLEAMDGASGFAGSFANEIDGNEVMRDIAAAPTGQRWQSSMEEVVKHDDQLAFKGYEKKKTAKTFSSHDLKESKAKLENDLKKRLDLLKQRFPDKYVEVVSSEESREAEVLSPRTRPAPTRHSSNEIKKIQFNEEMAFRKKPSHKSDIRRMPARPQLKKVGLDSQPYVAKARSFLDAVNGDAEMSTTTTTEPTTETFEEIEEDANDGCEPDQTTVWLTFENSIDKEQESVDSSFAPSKDHCRKMCNQQNCNSFAFFEKDAQCQLNMKNEGMLLKEPPRSMPGSTTAKFCFPDSLTAFRGCGSFIGFRDYALEVVPREQFDGLPTGREGMQLCIELCVLSTEYTCRSASFLVSEGKCMLNSDDSGTSPDSFQPSLADDHLYFENACSTPMKLSASEQKDTSIERVSSAPKSTLKQLQIKPIKASGLRVKQQPTYSLASRVKNTISSFFSKW